MITLYADKGKASLTPHMILNEIGRPFDLVAIDCDAGEQPAHNDRVVLSPNSVTLQEALSQVVSQAPGLVWMMREERHDLPASAGIEYLCRLGYFDGRNEAVIGPDYATEAAPMYFNYRKVSIYGGSNEIQRNIVAKAILGL